MEQQLIQVRPNESNGLWLGYILPIALTASFIKHNVEASLLYQYCFLLNLGIFLSTIVFNVKYLQKRSIKIHKKHFILPAITSSIIFYIFSHQGILFCSHSAILSTVGFYNIFQFILKKFPLSFTLGEALFCSQGVTIFLYSTILNLYDSINIAPKTSLQISTVIIQVGLSSIGLICYLGYRYEQFRTPYKFYTMSVIIITFFLLLPLQLLLRKNPLLWIVSLCTKDISTIILFIYWITCSVCAMYAVNRQIQGARKASTVIRKSFHVLAVLVFLPGLLYECSLIYLASGITLGIFTMLELLRNLNIPPLGPSLQEGFMVFSDEKDVGAVALTPIYLLVGCALPLWLHPAPCDLTDSVGFNLLPLISGLLSVGVGDSIASYLGMSIGKHKWSGSNKTIEGSLGCILGQILFVYLLFILGYCNFYQNDLIRVLIAIVTVTLVEAKTTQVDNLVLPLLMYTMLL